MSNKILKHAKAICIFIANFSVTIAGAAVDYNKYFLDMASGGVVVSLQSARANENPSGYYFNASNTSPLNANMSPVNDDKAPGRIGE